MALQNATSAAPSLQATATGRTPGDANKVTAWHLAEQSQIPPTAQTGARAQPVKIAEQWSQADHPGGAYFETQIVRGMPVTQMRSAYQFNRDEARDLLKSGTLPAADRKALTSASGAMKQDFAAMTKASLKRDLPALFSATDKYAEDAAKTVGIIQRQGWRTMTPNIERF